VLSNTYGCTDPKATRALTDPNEARGPGSDWFTSTFAAGNCVSITPRSPWTMQSLDGDVAMMAYAGTVGPPGSYYIQDRLLVDPQGRHPSEAPVTMATPPAAGPRPAGPIDSASPTALAPQPGLAAPAAPASSTGQPIVLRLIAVVIAGGGGFLLGRMSVRRG
jgi:hypothetical protein